MYKKIGAVLSLLLLTLILVQPVAAFTPVERPLQAMPSDCNPVTVTWETNGPAYEHPGQNYLYDVYITVNCPDDDRVANFRVLFNSGWGGQMSSPGLWEDYNSAGQESIGCSPGVTAYPNNWQVLCSQYTSWNVNGNPYRFYATNTPSTYNCVQYIGQTVKFQWNNGTVSSPVWQDVVVKNRAIVYRYCT